MNKYRTLLKNALKTILIITIVASVIYGYGILSSHFSNEDKIQKENYEYCLSLNTSEPLPEKCLEFESIRRIAEIEDNKR